MRRRLRAWLTGTLAEALGSAEPGGGPLVASERLRRASARLGQVEGAVLHFWLLPGREDLRAVRRRVHRVRREVRALESELSRLEALLDEVQG